MIKFIQCRTCLGKNGKVAEPGYISTKKLAKDGKTEIEVLTECTCHRTWRKKVRLEGRAKRSGLNLSLIDYDVSRDYVGTVSKNDVNRIVNYCNKRLTASDEVKAKLDAATLYVYGPNGTQKTSVVNWLGYQFLKDNRKVKYILMNDLIKMLQKADRDEDIQSQLDSIANVDLLIIDEAFDAEKVTIYKSNYQIPFLDTFLRQRIQNLHKGIVFVSNVKPEEIEANKFSHSIQDLVERNVNLYNSFLVLKDNYISNKSTIDTEDLF